MPESRYRFAYDLSIRDTKKRINIAQLTKLGLIFMRLDKNESEGAPDDLPIVRQ